MSGGYLELLREDLVLEEDLQELVGHLEEAVAGREVPAQLGAEELVEVLFRDVDQQVDDLLLQLVVPLDGQQQHLHEASLPTRSCTC